MTTEQSSTRTYDLLLKGGRVIDPANNVDDLLDEVLGAGDLR